MTDHFPGGAAPCAGPGGNECDPDPAGGHRTTGIQTPPCWSAAPDR